MNTLEQCVDEQVPNLAYLRQQKIETHDGYALALRNAYRAKDGVFPVSAEGSLYRYNQDLGIWEVQPSERLEADIANTFDGGVRCQRVADYKAIAQQTVVRSHKPEVFEQAPRGVALKSGFLTIDKWGRTKLMPLCPEHYQRFQLPMDAEQGSMPIWQAHVDRAFQDDPKQAALLQEIMGAILFRLLALHQKVAMFIGLGLTGKSATLEIIQSLIPAIYCCATSPFKWDSEYYVAALAGKLLNTVGELPDDKPIPSSAFKQVTGGDLLQGRNPTHRPFEFRCTAAHVFNTNHLINTRDRSSAFFRRWLILEFNNVLSTGDVDENFARKVAEQEGAQILAWAIEGATRVVRNGFTKTETHKRLMQQWQVENNSVLSWLLDPTAVTLKSRDSVLRSVLYDCYKDWCRGDERQPLGKRKFIKELENPVVTSETGVEVRLINGAWYVCGMTLWIPPGA